MRTYCRNPGASSACWHPAWGCVASLPPRGPGSRAERPAAIRMEWAPSPPAPDLVGHPTPFLLLAHEAAPQSFRSCGDTCQPYRCAPAAYSALPQFPLIVILTHLLILTWCHRSPPPSSAIVAAPSPVSVCVKMMP